MQVIGKSIKRLVIELESRRVAAENIKIEMENQRKQLETIKESYSKTKREERNTLKRYTDLINNLKARGMYEEVMNEWEKTYNNNNIKNSKIEQPVRNVYGTIKGVNDLATTNKRVADLWHPTKNGDLTPYDVTEYTPLNVWWLCPECGYEWENTIENIIKYANGCPVCTGKVVIEGINDLKTLYPDIAEEWYQPMNGGIKPEQVAAHSGIEYYWRCKYCHYIWKEQVQKRTRFGKNCERCDPKKSLKKGSYPEIAILMNIHKIEPDIIHKYRFGMKNKEGKRVSREIDILIPKLMTGIEYDGWYFHDKSERCDDEKDTELKNRGITIIRVKESKEKINAHWVDENTIIYTPTANYNTLIPVIKLLMMRLFGICQNDIDLYKPRIINEWNETFNTDKKMRDYNIIKSYKNL